MIISHTILLNVITYPCSRCFWYQSPLIDGLVQERRNSIANALKLHLSCTNPSIWNSTFRFLESLTTRRRQTAEKLAEDAIQEAKRKDVDEAQVAAEALTNGIKSGASTPATTPSTTPATTPTAVRGGKSIMRDVTLVAMNGTAILVPHL